MTHTFAILQVSQLTYDEIRRLLEADGYADQFKSISGRGEVIDMHGLALMAEVPKCPQCGAGMCRCALCGKCWCLDHQVNPLVCPGCGKRSLDGS